MWGALLERTSPSNLSILKLRLFILSCGDEGKHTRQLASEYTTSKKYWAAMLGELGGGSRCGFQVNQLLATLKGCYAGRERRTVSLKRTCGLVKLLLE
jgi:hypothetical protein